MPAIFPPEIINYSAEKYYSKINTRSRIIYVSVSLFLATILILLPIIKIDITSQSRGVVRTPFENTLIQSAVYAEIVRYNLSENKYVQAGDTLLILNTDRLDEQISLGMQKKSKNELFIRDIRNLLTGNPDVVTPRYQSERNRYRSKLSEHNTLITFLKKEQETAQKLLDKKVIAEFEYLQQQNNLDKALASLASTKDEYQTNWHSEQVRLELENQTFESNVKQLEKEKRQYVLIAPASGNLVRVAGFQPGNFIAPNQEIAYISGSDSLLVECYISPSDIGYIHLDQQIKFQVDAFNYREWGFLQGKVKEVLKDAVAIDNRPMFRVRCSLEQSCLRLKNGYQGHLEKGMTLTGRFYLTKRSLWQLFFDKADDWLNPKNKTR